MSSHQQEDPKVTFDELTDLIEKLVADARQGGLSDETISVAFEAAAEFLDDSKS